MAHTELGDHNPLQVPISCVVMTRNEERSLPGCLASLADFSEIFVVDSGSTDRTVQIANRFGRTVVPFEWNGRYPKKKQWCLESLPFKHEWVLYVDADERATPELVLEMRSAVASARHAGYLVNYEYVFEGCRMRHGHRIRKLVLLKHQQAHFPELDDLAATNMWEVEGHYQPAIDGEVGRLRSSMVHDDQDSLFDYLARHNRYSDWEAHVRFNPSAKVPGYQSKARKLVRRVQRMVPFPGLVAFVHSYVLRAGFRDGRAGFHYAISRGFYYWQIERKIAELARDTVGESGAR